MFVTVINTNDDGHMAEDLRSVLEWEAPNSIVQPDGVLALCDVLLWDAFMRIQNGQMKGVTWSDVDACAVLKTQYGPLADRLCHQASCVERIRGTSNWQATMDAARARIRLGQWDLLRQLGEHTALEGLVTFLQDDQNLGTSTAFVKCFTESMDADDTVAPSSQTHGISERIARVGAKWKLEGNMLTGVPKLLSTPVETLIAIVRDMRNAVRGATN